jgi:hypothetical protein
MNEDDIFKLVGYVIASEYRTNIIKCIGNTKIKLTEDPLRILRAIRFEETFISISSQPRSVAPLTIPRKEVIPITVPPRKTWTVQRLRPIPETSLSSVPTSSITVIWCLTSLSIWKPTTLL